MQKGAASLQNELTILKSREATASNEAILLRDKLLKNPLLEKKKDNSATKENGTSTIFFLFNLF